MQTTNHVFLICPSNFVFNLQTASTNAFQNSLLLENDEIIRKSVIQEFEGFATTLKMKGVNVSVFEDTFTPIKPDAIFPNNWISMHADGTVILYPMFAENRRTERRQDIIELLKKKFQVTKVIDLSLYEEKNQFLEGTGSIVFDHHNKIAYACSSKRTNKELFIKVCLLLKYKPIYFHAVDKTGKEVYHTNVMMCITEKFAVICLDSITKKEEKKMVLDGLKAGNYQIIEIAFEQMNQFAGNMLALKTIDNKSILALSQAALESLNPNQKSDLRNYIELVPFSIKTIEAIGGGSVRCMMAEIFLPKKNNNYS
jgi:hypothetical protein